MTTTEFGRSRKSLPTSPGAGPRSTRSPTLTSRSSGRRSILSSSSSSSSKQPWMSPMMMVRRTRASLGRHRFGVQRDYPSRHSSGQCDRRSSPMPPGSRANFRSRRYLGALSVSAEAGASGSFVGPVAGAIHKHLDQPVLQRLADDLVREQRIPALRGPVGGREQQKANNGTNADQLIRVIGYGRPRVRATPSRRG